MKSKVNSFEDLDVWKKAVELAIQIYKISDIGKLKNDFGAKDQLSRATCSISNNIAEGFEYNNNKDFIKFLRYAKGSSGEVRNQLYILYKIEYIDHTTYSLLYEQLIDTSKQLANFIKYLKSYEHKNL